MLLLSCVFLFCYYYFAVLRIEPVTLHKLGKCPTTELRFLDTLYVCFLVNLALFYS